jgi:hypothetical protein
VAPVAPVRPIVPVAPIVNVFPVVVIIIFAPAEIPTTAVRPFIFRTTLPI